MGCSEDMPISGRPELPRATVVEALECAGVTERRTAVSSALLDQPVLIVRPSKIYDQDGAFRARFRMAKSNPSFFRQMFRGEFRVVEVVDMYGRLVLKVGDAAPKFKAIAADDSELGMVLVRHGYRPRQLLQIDGENVGSLFYVNNRVFSVHDPQEVEVGRITHIPASIRRKRLECNVVEFGRQMPSAMRPLMISASKAVSHLNAPGP